MMMFSPHEAQQDKLACWPGKSGPTASLMGAVPAASGTHDSAQGAHLQARKRRDAKLVVWP